MPATFALLKLSMPERVIPLQTEMNPCNRLTYCRPRALCLIILFACFKCARVSCTNLIVVVVVVVINRKNLATSAFFKNELLISFAVASFPFSSLLAPPQT